MYDDNKIISEENINKSLSEYNNFNKVKMFNLDEDFLLKFNNIIDKLNITKHDINNLINLSTNSENLSVLKNILEKLDEIILKLHNLYEISFVQDENTLKQNNNIKQNKKDAINNLLSFLEDFYNFVTFEDNNKIKNSLTLIYFDIISIIKQLINIDLFAPKVVSLFRRFK